MQDPRPKTARDAGSVVVALLASGMNCGGGPSAEGRGSQMFASPQASPVALSPGGSHLFVVNTPGGRLDVFDTATRRRITSVPVGVEPVGVAVRPDGTEVWVANHVSDSVTVVDVTGPPSSYRVVATIQSMDANLVTTFDEPVAIAFASDAKAYVSLSSRNQIAVVDAGTHQVTGFLSINAQEPRAMVVRGGRLYVPAFESGNQSELSSCVQAAQVDGDQCTFDFTQINFAADPNMTTVPVDIVKDPSVPDRDLFVFDTATDAQVDVVSGIGTLLYGIAVDSAGNVFIPQTDARNADNGRAGTQGEGLADLENRIFLNQVGTVDCTSLPCAAPSVVELEPPPGSPVSGLQLATPFGIAISDDDATLVATAAASNRVFTLDAASGVVLGRATIGNIPRGLALQSDANGAPATAWVLNALDNTISVVDVADPANPVETHVLSLTGDPTPEEVRLGRIAFESAAGSTNGTFSCASCHPDGNTDQLLWIIGSTCSYGGCSQEEVRSTMPVRGLRDTLPLHWDGTLGDPFGGPNGEVSNAGVVAPNCTTDDECFRHLVNAALGGVMCDQTGCGTNDVGEVGSLDGTERQQMATFLQTVSYPPPRSRRPDDVTTTTALAGFDDFFTNVGGNNPPGAGGVGPETCADAPGGCHALPHGVSTNSPFVGAFEGPTMRGITDRFTLFSAGVTNVEELLILTPFFAEFPWTPAIGFDEFTIWAVAFGPPGSTNGFTGGYNVSAAPIFQMIEEMSNGHSGAFGRQVTMNASSAGDAASLALLAEMESADAAGFVNVRGQSWRSGRKALISLWSDGNYRGPGLVLSPAELVAEAAAGTLEVTLTAELRAGVDALEPQPTLSVPAVGGFLTDGRPDLPVFPGANPMNVDALHVESGAQVLIDGVVVGANVSCLGGSFNPECDSDEIEIDLATDPTGPGTHLLQIQNPSGLLSNELPILVQ